MFWSDDTEPLKTSILEILSDDFVLFDHVCAGPLHFALYFSSSHQAKYKAKYREPAQTSQFWSDDTERSETEQRTRSIDHWDTEWWFGWFCVIWSNLWSLREPIRFALNLAHKTIEIVRVMSSVQCSISNIKYQCSISNIKYQISNIKYQISMFNIKYQISMFNVQCPISNIKYQCSMFNVQCSMFNVQYQISNIKYQCSMFNVQCSMFNIIDQISNV